MAIVYWVIVNTVFSCLYMAALQSRVCLSRRKCNVELDILQLVAGIRHVSMVSILLVASLNSGSNT